MAKISIKTKKSSNKVSNGIHKIQKKRSTGPQYIFLFLTLFVGILLLISYLPLKLENDSVYAGAAIILEREIDGINALKLAGHENIESSDVVFIDLKEQWRELHELLVNNRTVILTGVAPFPAAEVAELLDSLHVYSGYLEFDERGAYVKEVLKERKYSALVFRVHYLKEKEYPNYDIETATTRYIRAIRERSVDAVLFVEGSSDTLEYEELVRSVKKSMIKERLLSDTIESVKVPLANSRTLGIATGFLLIASWNLIVALAYLVILIISPWLSLPVLAIIGQLSIFIIALKVFKKKNVFLTVSAMFVMSLFLGVAINSQLVDPVYQNGIDVFRGVKLSLIVLPFMVFVLSLSKIKDLKFRKIDIFMIVIFVLGAIYYLLRSGNYSFVLDAERRLRDLLDNLLVVRPRFKELLGYPFLILTIYNGFRPKSFSEIFIPVIGSVSIASVVNTFCHSTSPLWTQLLRSLYGISFGITIGLIVIGFIKLVKRERPKKTKADLKENFLNEETV